MLKICGSSGTPTPTVVAGFYTIFCIKYFVGDDVLGIPLGNLASLGVALIGMMLPIGFSFAGYKLYATDKKKVKIALLIVLILICVLGATMRF